MLGEFPGLNCRLGLLEVLNDFVDKRLCGLGANIRENELLVDAVTLVDDHNERGPLVDAAKCVLAG